MRQKQGTYDRLCKNYGKADLENGTDLQCDVEDVVEVSNEVRILFIILIN